MAANRQEYRYSAGVRQRAMALAVLSSIFVLGLLGVLVSHWAEFSWGTRALGGLLLLILMFTVRAQLGRALFRCSIGPEHLRLVAPLTQRTILWKQIREVRRVRLPQFGGQQRWACTLQLQAAGASAAPVFAFDDQLENAESALQDVVQHTPDARHTNISAEN